MSDVLAAITAQAGVTAPVVVPAAADIVVERISRAVFVGALQPGDRLPPERELAEQLAVSRTTVRAALRRLEADGLLRSAGRGPGGGPTILAAPSPPGKGVTSPAGRHREFVATADFRVVCEGGAAALAAERRTAEDVARMRAAIDELAGAGSPHDFRLADAAFHLAVAHAAGNDLLIRAIEDARATMFRPLQHNDYRLVIDSTHRAHGAVADAIERARPQAARRAMALHIQTGLQELLLAIGVEPVGAPR